jgi:hypothetical protein
VGSGAITDGETDAKNASVDGPLHNRGRGNGCGSGNYPDAITDEITDPSAFLRIADRTTDAKSAGGKRPFTV